jgi:hypothetical protein
MALAKHYFGFYLHTRETAAKKVQKNRRIFSGIENEPQVNEKFIQSPSPSLKFRSKNKRALGLAQLVNYSVADLAESQLINAVASCERWRA